MTSDHLIIKLCGHLVTAGPRDIGDQAPVVVLVESIIYSIQCNNYLCVEKLEVGGRGPRITTKFLAKEIEWIAGCLSHTFSPLRSIRFAMTS